MAHKFATGKEMQSFMGNHPRPKWGPLFAEGKFMDSAKEFEKAGMFYQAGCRYLECGRHRLAFRMARKLLADPETKNEGISNFELASRLVVKLWKSSDQYEWVACAKRLAESALASGRMEEAVRIFEDAGYISHVNALRARSITPPPIGNAYGVHILKLLKETLGD